MTKVPTTFANIFILNFYAIILTVNRKKVSFGSSCICNSQDSNFRTLHRLYTMAFVTLNSNGIRMAGLLNLVRAAVSLVQSINDVLYVANARSQYRSCPFGCPYFFSESLLQSAKFTISITPRMYMDLFVCASNLKFEKLFLLSNFILCLPTLDMSHSEQNVEGFEHVQSII